jgi:hypothetical protein
MEYGSDSACKLFFIMSNIFDFIDYQAIAAKLTSTGNAEFMEKLQAEKK